MRVHKYSHTGGAIYILPAVSNYSADQHLMSKEELINKQFPNFKYLYLISLFLEGKKTHSTCL